MSSVLESQTWYYVHDKKKVGPVPWARLRELAASGQLRPGDMVLSEGGTRWIQALAVQGLFPPAAIPVAAAAQVPGGDRTVRHQTVPPVAVAASLATITQGAQARPAEGGPLPSIPGYTLLGELGRGGMGVVYQAQQVKLKRVVALKMVLGGAVAGPQQLQRFRAEAEAVARLQHPNIVQVYEVGEHDGLPYFSLEYCAGGGLAQRLDGTPMLAREAAALIETLARAMQTAHQAGIVHRDLKPANILFSADGTPKITDFGLAKKLDDAAVVTQSGAVMGTPSYMAPEQAMGKNRELGPAADIYALGAILYEMLTGRPPFKGATAMDTMLQVATDEPVPPSRLQSKVPADLETVCLKCLEKAPARRYATAQALADDLRCFLNGESIQARPAALAERCWKWARRKPAGAALVVVSVLAMLVMLGGWLYFTVQLGLSRGAALEQKAKAETEREHAQTSEKKAEEARLGAEKREAVAQQQLDVAQRTLMTAQVGRAAGIWNRDPLQALQLLQDPFACPPRLRDFSWRYYHGLCQQWQPVILAGHHPKGAVLAVAISPDNKVLATGSNDGFIKLWDLETGKEKHSLKSHTGTVSALAFRLHDGLLASGGTDKLVKLWDPIAGKLEAALPGHSGSINGLAFSRDGKRLFSGGGIYYPNRDNDHRWGDGEARMWDVDGRKEHKVPFANWDRGTAVLCVAYAPDGQSVAIGTSHGSYVRVYNAHNGQMIDHFGSGAGWVHKVAYSPDSTLVAWAGSRQETYLRDLPKHETIRTLAGHQHYIDGLAWSEDGQTLATGANDGRVKLWNPANGQERLSLAGGAVRSLALSRDGKILVAGQDGGKATVWRLNPRRYEAEYPAATGFSALAVTPDSAILAGATREKTVRRWELASGKELPALELGPGLGMALACAHEGKLLAVGVHRCDDRAEQLFPEGEWQLWDIAAGRRLATLKGTNKPITAVAFTLDSGLLITGDLDAKVRLWDVAGRREVALLGSHEGPVNVVVVSPDGRTLASCGGNEIKLWDLTGRRHRLTLAGHTQTVRGLSFLGKGQVLVSTGWDGTVRFWGVDDGKVRGFLPGQGDAVHCLSVSPDGQTLALGLQDRTVKLWDLSCGQLRAVFAGHTREVNDVVFCPNGHYLVSASAANAAWWVKRGEVLVWKAPP